MELTDLFLQNSRTMMGYIYVLDSSVIMLSNNQLEYANDYCSYLETICRVKKNGIQIKLPRAVELEISPKKKNQNQINRMISKWQPEEQRTIRAHFDRSLRARKDFLNQMHDCVESEYRQPFPNNPFLNAGDEQILATCYTLLKRGCVALVSNDQMLRQMWLTDPTHIAYMRTPQFKWARVYAN